jgi:small-conductance mechanosensitive channel
MFDWNNIQPFINPFLIIIGSMVVGYIFQKILFSIIKKKTSTHSDNKVDFATRALKTFIIVLFMIGGVYAAIDILPLSPSTVNTLKQVSVIIIIFSVTYVIANITVGLINSYTKKAGAVHASTSIIANLIRILLYTIGFTFILQSVGLSITPIITALGIGGLAVALALQDTLSNFFAGLHIILSGQIKIGDYIRLEGNQEGYVTDIKWRTTTIRTLSNNLIIIPNSKLSSFIIINYYHPSTEMGISVDMVVGFHEDLNKVEQVCMEVAKVVAGEVKGVAPGSAPSVGFGSFVDNGVKFSVNFSVSEFTDQYRVKHEFIKRILPRFEKEGIALAYPVRKILMNSTPPFTGHPTGQGG